jgi:hypothetical protein
MVIISPLKGYFTHQRQQIAFGVAKEGPPQIVRRHFRDYVRLVFEVHPVSVQFPVCRLEQVLYDQQVIYSYKSWSDVPREAATPSFK